MARVYAGNASKVEPWILDAIATLNDEFWVLLEFTENSRRGGKRDIDCLILRPNPDPALSATILMTELKVINWKITGGWYGTWKVDRNGSIEDYVMSNPLDVNPLAQMNNASDVLGDMLKELSDRILDKRHAVSRTDIHRKMKSYPMLLINTPNPAITNTIDESVTKGHGMWFNNVDDWIAKVRTWGTTRTITLSHDEVARFVNLLGLSTYPMPAGIQTPASAIPPTLEPAAVTPDQQPTGELPIPYGYQDPGDPAAPLDRSAPVIGKALDTTAPIEGLAWLKGLHDWIQTTEARLSDIEGQQRSTSLQPTARIPSPRFAVVSPGEPQEWSTGHIAAVQTAIRGIARTGGRRDFPTVVKISSHYLGHDLTKTHYDGFGKAKAFFDQGVKQGIIQYGPYAGPSPTVFLPDETMPL